MKKDWEINLWERLKERREKKLKENKVIKKNYDSMSFVERNAYEEIINREDSSYFWIVMIPFYSAFYVGIFGLVMKYAFNVDLLTTLKLPVLIILGIFPQMIIVWIFFVIFNLLNLNKIKRKLLLNKKLEERV